MENKKILVTINADEKYPFYAVDKAERLIGGTAQNSLHVPKRHWLLETVEDVLNMTWLDFFEIPAEKYEWIKSVYAQLDEVNKYIETLTSMPKRERKYINASAERKALNDKTLKELRRINASEGAE